MKSRVNVECRILWHPSCSSRRLLSLSFPPFDLGMIWCEWVFSPTISTSRISSPQSPHFPSRFRYSVAILSEYTLDNALTKSLRSQYSLVSSEYPCILIPLFTLTYLWIGIEEALNNRHSPSVKFHCRVPVHLKYLLFIHFLDLFGCRLSAHLHVLYHTLWSIRLNISLRGGNTLRSLWL